MNTEIRSGVKDRMKDGQGRLDSKARVSRLIRPLQKLGLTNRSNLFWYGFQPYNFGDWIGPYLFKAFTGRDPLFCYPAPTGRCRVQISAGSILRYITRPDVAEVWGSGVITRDETFARPLKIYSVRGPHSQARCHAQGYACPDVFGDPGILMPQVYKPARPLTHRVGLVPHYRDIDDVRAACAGRDDLLIIDVRCPVETVIDDVLSCEGIVSSSLHGLIMAHAYGRPAAWVEFSDRVNGDGVKFHDHFSSGGISALLEPERIGMSPTVAQLETLLRDAPNPDVQARAPALRAACPFR
jgi:pyruvyltransferase